MESITPKVIKLSEFPNWISRGSTWINHNGFLVDMANLPPETCKIETDWWRALRCWYEEKAPFVSEDEVKKAYLAMKDKQACCEYCKLSRFSNFFSMKRVAAKRKRRAAMPERKKKLNKYTRKMYFVEVDWDKD